MRTAPAIPCGPVTRPTQIRLALSVTAPVSAPAGCRTGRFRRGARTLLRLRLGLRFFRSLAHRRLLDQPGIAEKAADARAARVGDDNAVERALLGAAAGEPDLQRHVGVLSGERRAASALQDRAA